MTATLATPASNAIVNPADERPLSPWWLRAIVIVMVIGFTVLIAITALAYRNAPPIPHMVDRPARQASVHRRRHRRWPGSVPEVRIDG